MDCWDSPVTRGSGEKLGPQSLRISRWLPREISRAEGAGGSLQLTGDPGAVAVGGAEVT